MTCMSLLYLLVQNNRMAGIRLDNIKKVSLAVPQWLTLTLTHTHTQYIDCTPD